MYFVEGTRYFLKMSSEYSVNSSHHITIYGGTPEEYLSRFSGQISHILQADPENSYFQSVKEELSKMQTS